MKRLQSKLTYANVISTLCLMLLLGGGTAYAASSMLPKNSVGGKQIRKGAVSPAKLSKASKAALTGPSGVKGDTGPQGPKGDPGERGAPGPAATALFAQINSDGTVNASGSPVTVDHFATGTYILNFGRDVTHCAAIANQGAVPVFSSPGSDTGSALGDGPTVQIASPGSPEEEYAPGFPLADSISVSTWNGSSPNDSSFYIGVFC